MSAQPIDRRAALRAVVAGGIATLATAVPDSPQAAAREIKPDKLPANVKEATERVVKDAQWSVAHKSGSLFDLEGKDGKGQEIHVEVTTEGKVTGIERKIDVKDVPKPVMTAITERLPKFTAAAALELYSGDDIRNLEKADHSYELEGKAAKGHEVTVEVSAAGKVLGFKREIDLKNVPKVVMDGLSSKAPKFKPATAHRLNEDDKVVGFLFAGDWRKEKRESIIFVSPDGKEVEVQEDE
jgi:uncharacterized protein YuzE